MAKSKFDVPLSTILLVAMYVSLGIVQIKSVGTVPKYLDSVKSDVRNACVAYSKSNQRDNFAGILFGPEAGRLVALEDCVKARDPQSLTR